MTETGRDKRAAKSGRKLCVVSREFIEKTELIRFTLSPKKAIIPDVAGTLPGRGAWVKADAALVKQSYEKKIITKALKGGRPDTTALENLDTLMVARCQQLLGIGCKSGAVVGGGNKIKTLGTVAGLICACDAASHAAQNLLCVVDHDWSSTVLTSEELGAVFGRKSLDFAAVLRVKNRTHQMLRDELHRLEFWRGDKNSSLP